MYRVIFLYALMALFTSCAETQIQKDYITISGKIINSTGDSLTVFYNESPAKMKKIHVSTDGSFSDTIKLSRDGIIVKYKRDFDMLYMRNGDSLHLVWDALNMDSTITFSGEKDRVENMKYIKKADRNKPYFSRHDSIMNLERSHYQEKLNATKMELLNGIPMKEDTAFYSFYENVYDVNIQSYLEGYDKKQYIKSVLAKGKISPTFTDYENYDGGKTSLSDFRGKYVYIDIWATWCKPCIAEFPHLKKLKKQWENKNIAIVGLSIDKDKKKEKWKKMIEEKGLGGVQLWAPNSTGSSFVKDYKVSSVPRFILIDPEGKIVASEAPAPSQVEELEVLLEGLKI